MGRLRLRFNGAWSTVRRWRLWRGGGWRLVRRARMWRTGAWREFYIGADPVSVTISPSSIVAFGFFNPSVQATATAVVAGGFAPFYYTWTVVSHTGTLPVITNGTTAIPTFTQNNIALNSSEEAVFRVSVTDSLGQTAPAQTVDAFFYNSGLF